MIPVFMIGLYFGWLILLFGAQVAYAFQNRQVYLQEKQAESVNQRGREFIALRVMTQVAQQFHRGLKPPALNQLATSLGVPSRLVSQIVQVLVHSRLLVEALGNEAGYVPARPLDQITVHDILLALRAGQGLELGTNEDATLALVRGEFERVYEAEKAAAATATLQKLVDEAR
jgi:membrane protein